jgi:hypothetical protein
MSELLFPSVPEVLCPESGTSPEATEQHDLRLERHRAKVRLAGPPAVVYRSDLMRTGTPVNASMTIAARLRAFSEWRISAVKRREEGNDVPPPATVHEEIAVRREDLTRVSEFGHPDEARVGEAHRLVGVLPEKAEDIRPVIVEDEVEPNDTSLYQAKNRFNAGLFGLQHEGGLGQNGLARR